MTRIDPSPHEVCRFLHDTANTTLNAAWKRAGRTSGRTRLANVHEHDLMTAARDVFACFDWPLSYADLQNLCASLHPDARLVLRTACVRAADHASKGADSRDHRRRLGAKLLTAIADKADVMLFQADRVAGGTPAPASPPASPVADGPADEAPLT